MLIHALVDYYDILSKEGKVLPDGYSKVKIQYLVCLTEEGEIDEIINWQEREEIMLKNGKRKEFFKPIEVTMPKRTEKSGIAANYIEHRPLYLFGLNLSGNGLSPEDQTGKAKKSHEALVKTNLELLEDINTPVVCAYRRFLERWQPSRETDNKWLMELGKEYSKSSYAFCLSGYPDQLLHEDEKVLMKWNCVWRESQTEKEKGQIVSQCAIGGEKSPIARIHQKIKGVSGGLTTGTVLIGFNNSSEKSYGKEQSYNSNISESVMRKYTEVLNLLLSDYRHKVLLDDISIVFWAMTKGQHCEDVVSAMIFGQQGSMNADSVNQMLSVMMRDSVEGEIVEKRLEIEDSIRKNVDFYMLGLKPNSSRLAVKFIYRKKYADVLWNIARHQIDMQITKQIHPVSMGRLERELVSPKSKDKFANPALMAKLFEAVFYGSLYPTSLLETVVRRVRTDVDCKLNEVRAGLIKACINRRTRILEKKEEELKVALDKENQNQAYLCGRLFAVLEKLQRDESGNSLNRTIKDTYFSSAAARPAMVFPNLLKLSQNHLGKVKNPTYYNMLLQEIISGMQGEFPEILMLAEQGKFMVGYFQQYQSFFESSDKEKEGKKDGNR